MKHLLLRALFVTFGIASHFSLILVNQVYCCVRFDDPALAAAWLISTTIESERSAASRLGVSPILGSALGGIQSVK